MKLRRIAHVLLLGMGLWASGCDRAAELPSNDDRPTPHDLAAVSPERRPNVLLVLIDTLRADRVGAYGYDRPTTPALDALAREGVLFEQAYAPASWTYPSVPSLLTATFACEHGVVVEDRQLPDSLAPLPERFKRIGYATAAFYANPYVRRTGCLRGFDDATARLLDVGFRIDAEVIRPWLAERETGEPWFLYVHTLEPHEPQRLSADEVAPFGRIRPNFGQLLDRRIRRYKSLLRANYAAKHPAGTIDNAAQQVRALGAITELRDEYLVAYDAAVRLGDDRLGDMIQALKARGLWDALLVIVLSDHGEEFAEHGAYIHGQSVYEELVRVPFVIKFPGGKFAGTRVAEPVTTLSTLATIMDYLGASELAAGARAPSLLPLIRGESTRRPDEPLVTSVRVNVKKYFKPWALTRGDVNVAARVGDYKAIWNDDTETLELYNLRDDPHEKYDLSLEQPARATELRERLRTFLRECRAAASTGAEPVPAKANPNELRNIEALGYAGGDEPNAKQSPND